MPSLFKFLSVIAIGAGLIYAGMLAIVQFGTITPHEISEPVSLKAIVK